MLEPGSGATAQLERMKLELTRAAEAAEREAVARRKLLEWCDTMGDFEKNFESLDSQLHAASELVESNAEQCAAVVRTTFTSLRGILADREAAMLKEVTVDKDSKLESLRLESRECRENRAKMEHFGQLVQRAAQTPGVDQQKLDDIEFLGERLHEMPLFVRTRPHQSTCLNPSSTHHLRAPHRRDCVLQARVPESSPWRRGWRPHPRLTLTADPLTWTHNTGHQRDRQDALRAGGPCLTLSCAI